MTSRADIAAALISAICSDPQVIDVSEAERFGEDVIVVTAATDVERDAIKASLPDEFRSANLHFTTLFGLGSFTGDTKATRKTLSLAYQPPYNVYGTPENEELETLFDEVKAREREAWASMNVDERRDAINAAVTQWRDRGMTGFGNCWDD
ncbi:MAG: hypothetical protein QNJ05_04600 [Woeseiaceae bacterium]|nr:hypothetical protein [Woeseiaceae bacterium]